MKFFFALVILFCGSMLNASSHSTTPNGPSITVMQGTSTVAANSAVNVAFGDTVTATAFRITINDSNNLDVKVSTSITSLGSTGIVLAEWASAAAPVPYVLGPSSGRFNTSAGITHQVVITAGNGTTQAQFSFTIVQAPQGGGNTAPSIMVLLDASSANPVALTPGSTINAPYNRTVAAEDFGIVINDADNDNTSCSTTISNIASTGILTSEWSSGSAAVSYTLNPSTGAFNSTTAVTYTFVITADDGTDQSTFTFHVDQAAQTGSPAPIIGVNDGAAVSNGAAAAGSARDFGQQDIASGPTTAVVITVSNTAAAGASDLTPGTPSITGSGSAEFVLDVTGFPATIAPGGSATFTVAFDPSSTGSFTANVEFTHDDTSTATPFSFEVTGIGTTPAPAPILTVRDTDQNGVVISNGAAASGSRSFGTVLIAGIPTANNTVYIENDGNANMTLVLPTLSGSGFTMDTSNFLTTLTPGASCSIGFALTETTGGAYSATISFGHDDSSTTTPFSFDLAGTVDDGSINLAPGGGGGGGG
ncbi:MAG: choice-of-anchor D domain-containing protein, partial [Planctomycetes bacterium]|nr:choice-of-anchor D domain-containing protein [Planctomycetota bacterium]